MGYHEDVEPSKQKYSNRMDIYLREWNQFCKVEGNLKKKGSKPKTQKEVIIYMKEKFKDIKKDDIEKIMIMTYISCKRYINDIMNEFQWTIDKIERFLTGKMEKSKIRFCKEVIYAALKDVSKKNDENNDHNQNKERMRKIYFHSNDNNEHHDQFNSNQSFNENNQLNYNQFSNDIILKRKPLTHSCDNNKDESEVEKNNHFYSIPTIKICEQLINYYCCMNYENCPFKHPCDRIICIYQIEEGYCMKPECKYCHPNEISIDRIKGYVRKKMNRDIHNNNNKVIYYCLFEMKDEICPKYMMCDKLFCDYQHHNQNDDVMKKKGYIININNYKFLYNQVIHDIEINKSYDPMIKYEIKKIEMIINKRLEKIYNDYYELKYNEKGYSPNEIIAYHGTSDECIQKIIRKGFNLDKVKRKLYGNGMYFAQDFNVSIHYTKGSGKVLVVKLCTDGLKYINEKKYYVVNEMRSIFPLYIVTIKEDYQL